MIDILDYHQSVLEKYRSYIQSFVAIRDDRIRKVVDTYSTYCQIPRLYI